MSVTLFRENGPVHIEYYPKTASTALAFNCPVYLDTNGRLLAYTPAVAAPFLGLNKKAWAATDATTTRTPVEVSSPEAEYLITATTTGAAATDIGEYCDYVAATRSVNVGSTNANDIYVTDVISSTLVVGKFTRRLYSAGGTLE